MVVNLDASEYVGSHWVAIFAPNKQNVYYFDSLGAEPRGAIKEYLRKYKFVTKNKRIIQSITSDSCGYYAICFIYFTSIGETFESIMKLFSNHSDTDIFVRHIVRLLAM